MACLPLAPKKGAWRLASLCFSARDLRQKDGSVKLANERNVGATDERDASFLSPWHCRHRVRSIDRLCFPRLKLLSPYTRARNSEFQHQLNCNGWGRHGRFVGTVPRGQTCTSECCAPQLFCGLPDANHCTRDDAGLMKQNLRQMLAKKVVRQQALESTWCEASRVTSKTAQTNVRLRACSLASISDHLWSMPGRWVE